MLAELPSSKFETASQPSPSQSSPSGSDPRPGTPLEPRRLLAALKRARRPIAIATGVAVVVGALTGALAPKPYAAAATVLWEPPMVARADPGRELATLAQSVKLPANMLVVRDRVGRQDRTLEQLAKELDVTLGENSMLLTVTAHDRSAEGAAKLAGTVVDVFVEAQRERARERLREVVTALRQSLAQAEGEHDRSRARYDAFRAENHVDDFPAEVQAAIQDVARVRVAVNDAKVELRGVAARQEALRQARERNPESIVVSRTEQNIDQTRAAQLATELAELRSRYIDEHPRVLATSADLAALKARAKTASPTVSGQIIGRSSVHDALAAQVEESTAMRSAVVERTKALDALQREAEKRAAALTAVQGEAAGLLADVKVNEEHVALLLKQIAMAEDDVRVAASGFQVVSTATPPEHSERALGRIIAIATPLLALLLGALLVMAREAARLRVRCASEAAYFARMPVVWATSWPAAGGSEPSTLGLELADLCEGRTGVLGVAPLGDAAIARSLAALLVERLDRRGRRAILLDAASIPVLATATIADALECRSFGDRVAALVRQNDVVVVLLPPASDVAAMRAAARWLDGLLVVVESGTQAPAALTQLGDAVSVPGRGVGVVLANVPPELVSAGGRAVGEASRLFRDGRGRWSPPAPNVASA